MNRILLFLIFLGVANLSIAQQTQYYPEEPIEFTDQVTADVKRGGCEDCKVVAESFEELVEAGMLDSLQLVEIRNTAELMRQRQMTTVPGVANFIHGIVTVQNSNFSKPQYQNWQTVTRQFVSGSGTNSDVNRFLEFTHQYYGDSVLYLSQSRSWSVNIINPDLRYENGTLSLPFNNVTLIGSTTGDTLRILETTGTFYPMENEWEGKKGKITWASAGFDPKLVYATFDAFDILLSSREFVIEPATLFYAEKFNEPVKGKLTYKLMTGKSESASDYPMFETYENTLVVKNIMEDVQYIGGFTIKGQEIQGAGTNENPAKLIFYNQNRDVMAEAWSHRLLIRADEALSGNAEVFMFFDKDTIYHPGVDFRYIAKERHFIASQGKSGISQAPFVNTFQNIDMDVKRIFWDFDKDRIYMVNKEPMSVNNPPAFFQSQGFFDKTEFLEYQGQLNYNPISSVSQAMRAVGGNKIDARRLAPFFNPNLSVAQIEPLLFQMVADGFIYYDPATQEVIVRDKARRYVLANAKKTDYDYISMKSESDSMNAMLNLSSRILNIYGVYGVTLSAKHFVHAFPFDKKIEMSENRDFQWSGTLFAGNVDYFGENFKFDYDRFAVELNNIDSMVINVPTGELDEYGNPVLEPLKSVLSGLTGTLFIDAPFNKSGYLDIPGYPKFDNSSTAYAYYDRKKKFKDVYIPDSFHFAIDTFSMDSLNSFNFNSQQFTGRLNSAGIFPEIQEQLTMMPDGSLGFKTSTPDTGYNTYQGRANYKGGLTMSNEGLEGNGTVEYMNAKVQSDSFLFMPKQTTTENASLEMIRETIDRVEFPTVSADSLDMNWMSYEDSMILKQTGSKFNLFDDFAEHGGTLVITDEGLRGSGATSWGNTVLSSDAISYGGFSLQSDTAKFRIKSDDEDLDIFNLENAYASIDLENGRGEFRSNTNTPTYMPYNLYNISVNKFSWDINDSTIYFEPPAEKDFSTFQSLNKEQDSLRFKATGGSYDLNNQEMTASGVPYIAVADVHVLPKDGKVAIGEAAQMKRLEGASVMVDSAGRNFKLFDANITIMGKKDLKGEGKYDYVNRSGNPQTIDFPVISTYHRSNEDTLYTHADGIVYDTMDFNLDPQIKFRGDVYMHSKRDQLRFDGVSRLVLPADAVARSGWFRMNDYIDPKNVTVSAYNPVNYDGDSLYTGIHLRYDSTNLYGSVIGRKVNYMDYTVQDIPGKVKYDAGEDAYIVADSGFLSGNQSFGNLFRYENKSGNIHTEGYSDLGLDFQLINLDAYGTIDKVKTDSFYRFDEMVAFDFYLSDELTKEMYNDMVSQTYQSDNVDFFSDKFRRYFSHFLGDDQAANDVFLELNKTGVLTLPKKFDAPRLLLTDLKFHWDEETYSYLGKGTCGVALVNGQSVGKEMKYYVEFGFRRGNDYINLFLKAPTDEWYYISYENKTVHILTSNFKLNSITKNTKMKNRKEKKDAGTILFTIASEYRQQKFLQKMEYYVGKLE